MNKNFYRIDQILIPRSRKIYDSKQDKQKKSPPTHITVKLSSTKEIEALKSNQKEKANHLPQCALDRLVADFSKNTEDRKL